MRRVKKGMTLLEVVIALAIIGIMMIPLASGLLTSVKANKKSEDVQSAKLLGQQFIEKLRLQDSIKTGENIKFHNTDVLVTGNLDSSMLNIKTKDPVNGFDLEGIIKAEVGNVEINKGYKDNIHINKSIGLFVYLDLDLNNKIEGYIYAPTTERNEIEDCLLLNPLAGDKREFTNLDDIKIEIEISESRNIKLNINSIDTHMIIPNMNDAIVFYLNDIKRNDNPDDKDDPIIDLILKNAATSKVEVQFLKEFGLDKDTINDDMNLTVIGNNKTIRNIIYDTDNGRTGLYTVDLNIKNTTEIVETTKSQFYLGE